MRTPRLAGAVLTGAIAVAMSGCGGSSNDHLDATFAAKVNAVCQHAISDKAGHPFPLPSFDPRQPSPSQLPPVGSYFAKYGDAQYLISGLNQVGEPPTHAVQWDQLRSYIDQSSRNALAQQQVAKAKDVAGFEHTLDVSDTLQKKIDSLGKTLGFTSSSACGRYFG
jgi:hypothetical protein